MKANWLILYLFILVFEAACGKSGGGPTEVAGNTPISAVQSKISSATTSSVPTVRPESFGTGRAAMQAAYQVAVTGVPLELTAGQTYDLGDVAPGEEVLPATNAKLKVIGNGATITVHTNANGSSKLFALTNPIYFDLENVTFADSGADITQSWRGCQFGYVIASGSDNGYGNITYSGVKTVSGVSPLTVVGASAVSRIANIQFQNGCVFSNTYYGPNFQNQGDNVSGSWTCVNCRRAYFLYGVHNHNVAVQVEHDGTAPGSTASIEIASYSNSPAVDSSTSNITAKVDFKGVIAGCVLFQNYGDSGAAVKNVNLELNLGDAVWTPATNQVQFISYDSAGALQTVTDNVWDNITISGDFYRGDGSVSPSIYPIWVHSTQSTTGSLTINSPTVGTPGFAKTDYSGFVTQYSSI